MLLLVEDDVLLGPLYVKLLTEAGYQVQLVTLAAQVRPALRQQRFELVLLDVMLPGESGLELLEDLAIWQGQQVVVLSNLDQRAVMRRALALGAHDFIIKSDHTPDTFVAAVEKALQFASPPVFR